MRAEDFGGTFSTNAMPIALQVDDVPVAQQRLEAKGVTFVSETFDSGVYWQAICLDPDGNPLSLHRRYAPTVESPETPWAAPPRASLHLDDCATDQTGAVSDARM